MQREDKWKEFYREQYPERWKKRVHFNGFTEYHKLFLELLDARKGEQILESKCFRPYGTQEKNNLL